MQQYDKRYFIGSLTRHDTIINIPAETTLMVCDYCGSHIYRDNTLERINNDYGYWANGNWYYYIKDYQGNVRAVIGHTGNLLEVNNYYPYGALMGGGTVGNNASVQPYKYGTKELDRQNGLDWYDSQARMYDSLLGRTPTMDPKAEDYAPISPYAWCAGNPINRIDKNGMDWYFSKDGEIVWDNDVTSSKTTPREGLYLGSNFMGFTVERYQVKNYGLSIRIKHQSTLNTDKQYRWIQAVTTNNPMDGKKPTSIDKSPECDNKPFYYTDEEELKYSSQDRQTTVFIDKPARTKNGDDWNAELCLVSTDENKVDNNITINYGFYVDRIGPVLKKLKIHLNVSPTIQTALDEYEYKQNHEREGEGTH